MTKLINQILDDFFSTYGHQPTEIGNPEFAEWGYISFTELKTIRIPPGIEVDCELFDPLLKASEIQEIKIR